MPAEKILKMENTNRILLLWRI